MRKLARSLPLCCLLFAVNAVICWPLFRYEYLDNFQSNEGVFMAIGRFLREHFPHTAWFPWLDAGLPIENAYFPLVPALTALASMAAHCAAARALHVLTALAYCLGPVFLFLFARRLSGRAWPSFAAGLLWSVVSLSAVIPKIFAEMGTFAGSRRLQTIVFYGEVPHNFALSFLPLALFVLAGRRGAAPLRTFALSVFAVAAVMLSNAFGIVAMGICCALLFLSADNLHWRDLLTALAIPAAGYLLICRFLPPSLIALIRTNSQVSGGDYRVTLRTRIAGLLFLLVTAALWLLTRRLRERTLRFAILAAAVFGGMATLELHAGISFLPQPHRYHLEMEMALCLVAAFALEPLGRRLPRNGTRALAVAAVLAVAWLVVRNCAFRDRFTHPVDIARTVAFRQSRWIGEHLPGQRVFVTGENEFWLNLWADNPQLSAGIESTAPNPMQLVAVYIIDSGQNAGDSDGPVSVLWLKAFGCGAVTVPGPASRDFFKPVARPHKFDGLLPRAWSEGDDSVYLVPRRSTSLAHVIPASAVINRPPIHGLDVEPLRPYVTALDDPALPLAPLAWRDPTHGRLSTTVTPGQVVSVQMNYDPGWRATTEGRTLRIRRDPLGMMIVEPACAGHCDIDLHFAGGPERAACSIVGLLTGALLLAMLMWVRLTA